MKKAFLATCVLSCSFASEVPPIGAQQLAVEVVSVEVAPHLSFWTLMKNNEQTFMVLGRNVMSRLIVLAVSDIADGKLDGMAFGEKIDYLKEIEDILGIKLGGLSIETVQFSEVPHRSWFSRIISLGQEVVVEIGKNPQFSYQGIVNSLDIVADRRFDNAKQIFAKALLVETKRIIEIEMANGKIDGLGKDDKPIDWKPQIEESVKNVLSRALEGLI